jgi:hypothetical protein
VWPQGTVQQRIETFVAQWPDVYLLQSFFVTFLNPGSETARSPAKAFLETLGRFQADKVTPWLALRNTIGVAVPLAAGVALGAVSGGLAVATGALNVSFSDSHDPYVQRGGRMLVASVLVGLAVFVGSMWGGNNLAAVLIAGLWAFAAGMLVALNTTAADIGTISLVTLIVYSAVPQSPERAVYGGLLAFSGGLLQTLLAVLMWPLRRYAPERRALGELFIELAKAASKPVDALQSPPASAESTRAQTALATLSNARTPAGERYLLLLSQAERIRLSLLILIRLRVRMKRETPGSPQAVLVDSYLAVSSQLLHSIGTSLLAGQPIGTAADSLEKLEALAEELCCPQPGQSELAAAVATDARKQMDALTGQIRAAVDLETNLTPAGQKSFERGESEKPWRLRLAGRLATLRANLSLESTACRHAAGYGNLSFSATEQVRRSGAGGGVHVYPAVFRRGKLRDTDHCGHCAGGSADRPHRSAAERGYDRARSEHAGRGNRRTAGLLALADVGANADTGNDGADAGRIPRVFRRDWRRLYAPRSGSYR